MKTTRLLACVLLIIGAAAFNRGGAQTLTYSDIQKLEMPAADHRITYGSAPQQFGDLRLPKGKGQHPVAILIHGGCWYSEYDLNHIASFAAALTELGVATWTVEYRRVGNPGGGWPGTFADVALAADHLRVLARSYPLDLKRVITIGHSAGGQLALWLAARKQLSRTSLLYVSNPLKLSGVVSLAGITDMRGFSSGCNDAVRRVLGGTVAEISYRYRETSPIELLPLGVRQSLIQGSLDKIVPPELGAKYKLAAEKRGESVKLIALEGAGHFELIAPRSSAWPIVEKEVRSLLKLPKKQRTVTPANAKF